MKYRILEKVRNLQEIEALEGGRVFEPPTLNAANEHFPDEKIRGEPVLGVSTWRLENGLGCG
jgi:hypothetical protein